MKRLNRTIVGKGADVDETSIGLSNHEEFVNALRSSRPASADRLSPLGGILQKESGSVSVREHVRYQSSERERERERVSSENKIEIGSKLKHTRACTHAQMHTYKTQTHIHIHIHTISPAAHRFVECPGTRHAFTGSNSPRGRSARLQKE